MKKVIILGSTGSIGTQTLEVISSRRDKFEVAGISAGGSDVGLLAQQILDFSIPAVAIAREDATEELQRALTVQAGSRGLAVPNPRILTGADASTELAAMPADVVCNAITGAAGLRPTLATLAAGTPSLWPTKSPWLSAGVWSLRPLLLGKSLPWIPSTLLSLSVCEEAGATRCVASS